MEIQLWNEKKIIEKVELKCIIQSSANWIPSRMLLWIPSWQFNMMEHKKKKNKKEEMKAQKKYI